jgi:hypothetical protein
VIKAFNSTASYLSIQTCRQLRRHGAVRTMQTCMQAAVNHVGAEGTALGDNLEAIKASNVSQQLPQSIPQAAASLNSESPRNPGFSVAKSLQSSTSRYPSIASPESSHAANDRTSRALRSPTTAASTAPAGLSGTKHCDAFKCWSCHPYLVRSDAPRLLVMISWNRQLAPQMPRSLSH